MSAAPAPAVRWISDVPELRAAIDDIRRFTALSRVVAVDLEGVDLGRPGEICVVQGAVAAEGPVFLFDICSLGADAFAPGGDTLRALLEDASLEVLLFDLRADANALFYHFGVALARPVDLQLLDVAHRLLKGLPCRSVSGLGYLVEKTPHANLTDAARERLASVKAAAHELFVPERGGSYEVWRARPLPPLLLEYCTDAALFFPIRASFAAGPLGALGDAGAAALAAAAARRLDLAHSGAFDKSDRDRLIAIDEVLRADLSSLAGGLPPVGNGGSYRGRGRGFPRGRGRGGFFGPSAAGVNPE